MFIWISTLIVLFSTNILITSSAKEWIEFHDLKSEYLAQKGKFTYNQGDVACKRREAQLWVADNKEEFEFVWKYLDAKSTDKEGKTWWIGGMKIKNVWMRNSDRTPIKFLHWCPGEPNNAGGNEECLSLRRDCYNDLACHRNTDKVDHNMGFICQKPKAKEWIEFHDFTKKYLARKSNLSFSQADDACKSKEAQLWEADKEKFEIIWKYLDTKSTDKEGKTWWIGGMKTKDNVWVRNSDKTPIKFLPWCEGEPSSAGGNEHCLALMRNCYISLTCQRSTDKVGHNIGVICEKYQENQAQEWFEFRLIQNEYLAQKCKLTFSQADDACKSREAQLWEADNDEEFEIVWKYLDAKSTDKEGKAWWIGGIKTKDNVWVRNSDKTPIKFLPWCEGEPSSVGGNEHCLALMRNCYISLTCQRSTDKVGHNIGVICDKYKAQEWIEFHDFTKEYLARKSKFTFSHADDACKSKEAQLWEADKEKFEIIWKYLDTKNTDNEGKTWWIGGMKTEDNVWVRNSDKTPIKFLPWCEGEPSSAGGNKHCLALMRNCYIDLTCQRSIDKVGHNIGVICEKYRAQEWFEFRLIQNEYLAQKCKFTFRQADDACKSRGVQLWEADNDEEFEIVWKYLDAKSTDKEEKAWWIGGIKTKDNVWVRNSDKTPIEFLPWCEGEPNNAGGNEHCLALIRNCYVDLTCQRSTTKVGHNIGVICEKFKAQKWIPWIEFHVFQNDYIAQKATFTFSQAYDACKSRGVQLWEADNEEEFEIVWKYLDAKSTDKEGRAWWLGGMKTKDNVWVRNSDITPIEFLPWCEGEPNNAGGNEHCLALIRNCYVDLTCQRSTTKVGHNIGVICEKFKAQEWIPWIEFHVFQNDYIAQKATFTFSQAYDACKSRGVQLWEADNEEEFEIVWKYLDAKSTDKEGRAWWLGGMKTKDNVWVRNSDITPIEFLPWCEGEPNNVGGNEHCLALIRNCYVDLTCQRSTTEVGHNIGVICEKFKAQEWIPWIEFHVFQNDYSAQKATLTFSQAYDACKSRGVQLWEADNKEEFEIVWKYLDAKSTDKEGRAWWLGGMKTNDNVWVRNSDKTPIEFLPWCEGEPNNAGGNEHCLALIRNCYVDLSCQRSTTNMGHNIGVNCEKFKAQEWIEFHVFQNDYIAQKATFTFTQADDACKSRGVQLWEADNEEEFEIVWKYLDAKSTDKEGKTWWIGGMKTKDDVWVRNSDNRPIKFLPWCKGEPNYAVANEHCLALIRNCYSVLTCQFSTNRMDHNIGVICGNSKEEELIEFYEFNKEFFTDKNSFAFHEADEACKRRGSRLWEPNDEEEFKTVRKYLNPKSTNEKGKIWWIGGMKTKGNVWVRNSDEKPFEFLPWCAGEPNNIGGNEDCLALTGNCYSDLTCFRVTNKENYKIGVICEKGLKDYMIERTTRYSYFFDEEGTLT